jgi:hypothetical protein
VKKIILSICTILGLVGSSLVFAYGETVWCKVNFGRIQACYSTFDKCDRSSGFGDCQPYKQ